MQLNKKKIPLVIIDNSLEKFKKLPLFSDKVERTNEILRTIGLPKMKEHLRKSK